jgi:uncharacterized phage-like protein YoqJ
MNWLVDFSKLLDPEYQAEYQKRKEKEQIEYEQQEQLRKQTACATGHRPDKLGGYDMKNPVMQQLKVKLLEVIEELITKENITRFISGGALGTDWAFFLCVHILKEKYPHIKNILAVPFKNQDIKWSTEQKNIYSKIKRWADEIVYVDEIPRYKVDKDDNIGQYNPAKMKKRNEWIVDQSRIVVAVYDGSPGGTMHCFNYAHRGWRTIYRLRPDYNFELEVRYGMNG